MMLVSNITLITFLYNLGLHAGAASLLRGRGSQTLTETKKDEAKDATNAATRRLQHLDYNRPAIMNKVLDAAEEEVIPLEEDFLEEEQEYSDKNPLLPLETEDEAEDAMLSSEEHFEEPLGQEYYLNSDLKEEKIEEDPTYDYNYNSVGTAGEGEEDYSDYYSYNSKNGEMMTEDMSLLEDEAYNEYDYNFENAAMMGYPMLPEKESFLPTTEAEFTNDLDENFKNYYDESESFNQVLYEEEDLRDEYLSQNNGIYGEDQNELLREEELEELYKEEAIAEVPSYETYLESEIEEAKNYALMAEAEDLLRKLKY